MPTRAGECVYCVHGYMSVSLRIVCCAYEYRYVIGLLQLALYNVPFTALPCLGGSMHHTCWRMCALSSQ